jgi:hypothetical protein
MRLFLAIILAGLSFLPVRADDATATNTSSPVFKPSELFKYKVKVWKAVNLRWNSKVDTQSQVLETGVVKIQFTISSDGEVKVEVLAGSDLPKLVAISKEAIMEAAPFPSFTDSMRQEVGESFTDTLTFSFTASDHGHQSSITTN